MLRAASLALLAAMPGPAHDVTTTESRRANLLEYVAGRADLSRSDRRAWDHALRSRFGGTALRDGTDEGVTVAKSVVSAAIFFGVEPERGARAAYDAYHDAAHQVPPPIAINYQVLAFQGRKPAASARRMALDFPKHFDPDIAPELVRWWERALESGEVAAWERHQVEAALRETRARLTGRPAGDARVWRIEEGGGKRSVPETSEPLQHQRGWRAALDAAVDHWIGTPYRLGGTTRRGIDCSAFVGAVYREAFSIELPRNSRAQYRIGESIRPDELAPGDLVFFDTLDRGRVTHVGIYLGDDVFAHASSSKGVTRAQLSKRYYQRAWVGARRLFRAPAS